MRTYRRAIFGITFTLLFGAYSAPEQNSGPSSPAAAARQDKWTIVGPGGGGSQYCPTISPHDPRRVLVSCDMTGAYISQDGGNSWRMFNLMGTVRFFAFDPLDPDTMYAATNSLWRSSDGGATWSLVFPHPRFVTNIEMPSDHADATIVSSRHRYRLLTALAIDPADSNVLYAAVSDDGSLFLYTSLDKGNSWQRDVSLSDGVMGIFVDPRSPPADRTLYIVGSRSILIKEGGRWSSGTIPAEVAAFTDVACSFPPAGGKLVLNAVATLSASNETGIFISGDGGKNWRRSFLVAPSSGLSSPILTAIAAGSNHPEVAYVSYSNLQTSAGSGVNYFGVAKTTDGGQSWRLAWKESQTSAPKIHDIWISKRFGPSWGENPLRLGVSPNNPDICFGTDYGRTMRTTDGGETWEGVYSREMSNGAYATTGLDVTTNYGVHFDPFDSKRIFISYTDIGLFRSEDGGTTWVSSTTGVPNDRVNTTYWIQFDPDVKGRVWGAMSGTHDLPRPKMWRRTDPSAFKGGVCQSEDGGTNWKNVASNLPSTAATHIILDPFSPVSARTLYVAGFGRGVFKSADGGKTWSLKNSGIEGTQPFAWRFAHNRNGVLYLVVARKSEDGSYGNDKDGALYRSSDGAEHWERMQLPTGLNGPNGIAIDPEDPNRMYLVAWGRQGSGKAFDGGIFLSTDGGVSWRCVLSRDQHIYDVTIDSKARSILYACGFESSAWRSTDAGENWTRITGYNFKWGHRVIPDPQDPAKIFITTFGGSVWYGPAAGDPSALEDIVSPGLTYGSRR